MIAWSPYFVPTMKISCFAEPKGLKKPDDWPLKFWLFGLNCSLNYRTMNLVQVAVTFSPSTGNVVNIRFTWIVANKMLSQFM